LGPLPLFVGATHAWQQGSFVSGSAEGPPGIFGNGVDFKVQILGAIFVTTLLAHLEAVNFPTDDTPNNTFIEVSLLCRLQAKKIVALQHYGKTSSRGPTPSTMSGHCIAGVCDTPANPFDALI
jgi:hypothetical protein